VLTRFAFVPLITFLVAAPHQMHQPTAEDPGSLRPKAPSAVPGSAPEAPPGNRRLGGSVRHGALNAIPQRDSLPGISMPCTDVRGSGSVSILAQHLLSTGAIDTLWNPESSPLCLGTTRGVQSKLVPDGSGGAIVLWVDNRFGDGDIYGQHVVAGGSFAQGWSGDGVAVCTARGSQYQLAATSDGAGGAIAVWQDFRTDVAGDIYAQRITSAGELAWGTDGVAVCDTAGGQGAPTVTADGAGGAFVAWHDRRSGNAELYFQHLGASGEREGELPIGGIAVMHSDSNQVNPVLTSGGENGAFLVWEDHRSGVSALYALRLSAIGAPAALWTATGLAISSASGAQRWPVVVGDGSGGAFVAWSQRAGEDHGNILAQHVSATGTEAWGAAGVTLCSAAGEQSYPAMAGDGAGGLLVAWEDHRFSRQSDLYAQRVSSSGQASWAEDGAALCLSQGNQSAVALVSDGSGGALATWSDATSEQGQFLPSGMVMTGALPALQGIESQPGHVRLTWSTTDEDRREYRLERRVPAGDWQVLAALHVDQNGLMTFEDRGVRPGDHLDYRLSIPTSADPIILTESSVEVPQPKPLALSLSVWDRNTRSLHLAFTLATNEPARFDVFDVAGRRLTAHPLGIPGAGDYDLKIPIGPTSATGVYFVRLTQGRAARTSRLVVLQ
jgi:hypothetical protein